MALKWFCQTPGLGSIGRVTKTSSICKKNITISLIKDEKKKKKTINVFHSKQLLLWQFYHFGIADNACDCNGNYGIEGKQDCYKLFNQIKTKKFVNCFVTSR